MPITTGAVSSAVGTTAVSTFSWAHTVGTSDTLLVVGVAVNSSNSTSPGGGINSIRLGTTNTGAAFTKRTTARSTGGINIAERVELWTLANPTTGLSTRIHVAFANASMAYAPLGYGIGFQGTSAVGNVVAGASIGTSGLKSATVTVAGANDWAIAMFGKRIGTSWTTGGTSSDVLIARSTAGTHAAGVFRSELPGTSGQRTISASNLTAGVGIWAAMSLVETVVGGPSTLGILTAAGSATVASPLTVLRGLVPTAAGSATAVVTIAGGSPWTDNFNRGTGIGANWTGSVGGDLAIQASTLCTGAGAGDNSMYWNANTPADAQYAQAVLVIAAGEPDYSGPLVRASATDWIILDAAEGESVWKIEWYNGGSWTQLGATYSAAPANGDLARIEADGSAFEGFVNGVSRISGSNGSAPASGFTGAYVFGNTNGLDDFEGGDLAAGGVLGTVSATGSASISLVLSVLRAVVPTVAGSATATMPLAVKKALGPSFVGSATATTPLRVIRAIAPIFAGSATAATPLTVRKALVLSVAGSVTASSPLTVNRVLVVTSDGVATVIVALAQGGVVDLGTLLFDGIATVESPLSVLRALAPTFDGTASVVITVDAIAPAVAAAIPATIYIDANEILRSLREMMASTPQVRAKKYAGPYNAPTKSEHPIFPPGTMDAGDPDAYVEAVAAYDETFRAEKSAHENAVKQRDDNLQLGRRLQGQVPVPKLNPNIMDKEKLYEQSLEKIELKQAWTRNAKMAWVRSFKKKP